MSTTASQRGHDVWQSVPATWGAYLRLLRARGERNRPKYTFVHGRLTIVSPGMSHELLKTRLAWFVDEVLLGLLIDCQPTGQVTLLKTVRPRTGTESDASYYLTNLDQIRGKKDLVMGQDPPPDLAIEVVVSHPAKGA